MRDPVAEAQTRLILQLGLEDANLLVGFLRPSKGKAMAQRFLAYELGRITNDVTWKEILNVIEGPQAEANAALHAIAQQISGVNAGIIPPGIILALLQSLMMFLQTCQPQPAPVTGGSLKRLVADNPGRAYRICRRHAWQKGLSLAHAGLAASATCKTISSVSEQLLDSALKEHS